MDFKVGDVVYFRPAIKIVDCVRHGEQITYITKYGRGPFTIRKINPYLCFLSAEHNSPEGGFYPWRLEKCYDFIDD